MFLSVLCSVPNVTPIFCISGSVSNKYFWTVRFCYKKAQFILDKYLLDQCRIFLTMYIPTITGENTTDSIIFLYLRTTVSAESLFLYNIHILYCKQTQPIKYYLFCSDICCACFKFVPKFVRFEFKFISKFILILKFYLTDLLTDWFTIEKFSFLIGWRY